MPRKKQAAFAALNLVRKMAPRIRDIQLLVVDVDSRKGPNKDLPPTTKFPGGDEEPKDMGDPRFTANRELYEETGLRWSEGIFPHRVHRVHRVQVSRKHFRVGYTLLYEECEGELRATPTQGTKGTVSPGYWMTVEDLREQDKLHQNHSEALNDFVQWAMDDLGLQY